jgi:hypothetical protein
MALAFTAHEERKKKRQQGARSPYFCKFGKKKQG